MADRSFALVHSADQWLRCAHEKTALIAGVVRLNWQPDDHALNAPAELAPMGVGLAFDPWCRLYHSRPEQGQVERILWASGKHRPEAVSIFEPQTGQPGGSFTPVATPSPLAEPRALAVSEQGCLFVGETAASRILVYDLFERRLLRRVSLPDGARPLDMACDGRRVVVLVAPNPLLFVLDAWSDLKPDQSVAQVLVEGNVPARLAKHPISQEIYLLSNAGSEEGRITPLARPEDAFVVRFATDLEFMPVGDEPNRGWQLVVARGIGQDFARYAIGPGSIGQADDLKARDYDGRGIVRTPDGRIGYWTARDVLRHAVVARPRYERSGRVTTFQLDSGRFQTHWGRVFLDACIPLETSVQVHCVAIDEPPEESVLSRTPPANSLEATIYRPDLSPPMPPLSLLPEADRPGQRLHARRTGRELPWSRRAEGNLFRTYEAPVIASAGRYLWVTIVMAGNSRFTPRVKSLRVEYPAHDLLQRLPRVYSRGDHVDFLRRYLALFDGMLSDLECRAFHRRALIDPRSAPPELLPWLGGFVGMLIDERFAEISKRRLVEEAVTLFRTRGTIQGLQRVLEIYLGVTPIVFEHYRTRGLGGAFVGEGGDLTSRAVVGAGFRVGGKIGDSTESFVENLPAEDAFRLHAHRFSVILPISLSSEQGDVVNDLLERFRPAHTVVDVCTVDAGLRVGIGLYAALTSIVGRSAGFGSVRAGYWRLGRSDVLGQPGSAGRVGSGRIGFDSLSG